MNNFKLMATAAEYQPDEYIDLATERIKRGSFVMLLVYVDDDWKDIGGNVYPREGCIEAKEFTDDIAIEHGLCGILWGKIKRLQYEDTDAGHWLVVKAELSQQFIRTDYFHNYYKFRTGFVVFCGSYKSARNYIKEHEDGEEYIQNLT